MVTVVEVIRLEGDAFAALSLFRLLQWQLTHAASDEANIAKAARVGASLQSDHAASVPVPTAALLPARVAARLAATMAAADNDEDEYGGS